MEKIFKNLKLERLIALIKLYEGIEEPINLSIT